MNKRTSIFLGTLFSLAAVPAMAETVDKTVNAAADGLVDISNIAGSVTVAGWSKNEVHVSAELGRKVEELIVERDGDKVRIKVKVPKKGGHGIDSDLTINVPRDSSIDVGTVSADIEVAKVRGEQRLNTVSGDVDTTAGTSDISIEVVSGDIDVTGDGKDIEIRANAVSGDLTINRVGGTVEAESVSGDVEIRAGSFDRAELHTVNGDIEFKATLRDDGKLQVETVNGDVDLDFAGDVSARFDVDTFNGDIDNCFGPKPERKHKYTPGLELSFEQGKGSARVTVSTLNGDITICR